MSDEELLNLIKKHQHRRAIEDYLRSQNFISEHFKDSNTMYSSDPDKALTKPDLLEQGYNSRRSLKGPF